MDRPLLLLAIAAALPVAACDDRAPAEVNQPAPAGGSAQEELLKLNEANRAIGLKRAILDSGNRCKRVTATGYVQDYGNLSMWMARCEKEQDWAIFIGPDGSVQVRACKDMAQLGLPRCIIKAAPARPAGG